MEFPNIAVSQEHHALHIQAPRAEILCQPEVMKPRAEISVRRPGT